jgi:nucleotide-binding universal stress UspA family protein
MGFNTILIPVDFTVNTRVAIAKGIQLCEGPNPEIHLIHVPKLMTGGIFGYYQHLVSYFNGEMDQNNSRLQERLRECSSYIGKLKNSIVTSYSISFTKMIEKAIAEKAREIAADLIVIGKNSQHSQLPFLNTVVPSRLAKRTGISVLTVKPGALSSTVKTVVIPINSHYSEKKVDIINDLKKKFYLNIRLLLVVKRDDDPEKLQTTLVNTCRMLKNRSLDTISYEILHVGKKNWNFLSYCRKVDADLLIVHPGAETKIGWFNKHISDELPVNSKMQVLAVG